MLVESGHLDDIDYEDGVLTVRFKDQSVYEYYDVPVGTFQELAAAPSKSQFFRQHIKGAFEYVKVS